MDTIGKLSQKKEYYVMLSLAGNSKTPPSLLQLLAQNESDDIRVAVAGNINASNNT